MIGCFGLGYCTWLYGAWLPGYLEIQRHMSIRSTGYIAAIPFALAVLGAAAGYWQTGWRAVATRRSTAARCRWSSG